MADPVIARAGALGRLTAAAAALLLILAACGSAPAASPSANVAPVSTPTPSPEVTASPEPTASPADTPAPTRPTAASECTPDATTPMSADWVEQASLSGDYTFKRPADWADLSGELRLQTSISVSPGTFTETGLPEDAEHQVDAVRAFDGSILVTAWVIDGVTTRTDALFERELAWLEDQPQMIAVNTDDLETCIGGSRARGFSSRWTSPSGETNFVIFVVQRNGKMYETQLTAPAAIAEVTYRELLNTWEFTEPLQGPPDLGDQFGTTDFKVVGMASQLDRSIPGHPNPETFQSSFLARTDRIYVIYELDDGAADTIDFSWARGDRVLFANSYDYGDTTFAWGWITPPSSGLFATGSYTVTLTLKTSGDTITVPFTVE